MLIHILEQLKIVYRKRYNNLRGDETAEELKKIIAQSRISLDNLDNITETGFDKYLFL